MERSAIRERSNGSNADPGFRCAPSGLHLENDKMPFADFRQFLDVLRQHSELIDINRPVALNDVGKAMKQSYVRNGPAIMFNNNGTDYPLVAGIFSTRRQA